MRVPPAPSLHTEHLELLGAAARAGAIKGIACGYGKILVASPPRQVRGEKRGGPQHGSQRDRDGSSADEIGDLSVGVARGTTQDISLTEMAPEAEIVRFEDDATTAAAFLSGQVDCSVTANIVAQDLVRKDPNLDLVNKFVIRTSPAHMGVRHGEFDLLRWLDTFIFYNKMNGTLDELHRKWMGEAMKPLPSF
jgi:ABC-type amino acid transport substrate-binding protein